MDWPRSATASEGIRISRLPIRLAGRSPREIIRRIVFVLTASALAASLMLMYPDMVGIPIYGAQCASPYGLRKRVARVRPSIRNA